MKINIDDHIDQYEIKHKALELFDKDYVLSLYKRAKTSSETQSIEMYGKLFGGNLKITLTFEPEKP